MKHPFFLACHVDGLLKLSWLLLRFFFILFLLVCFFVCLFLFVWLVLYVCFVFGCFIGMRIVACLVALLV